jgi:Mg2+/Co2+ transporter CorB
MNSVTLAAVGIAATVLLLLCSAFFSSTEIAIFSLSPEWIDERATGGDPAAVTLQELRSNPHRLLVTVLVGNNVVNIAISSILTVLLAEIAPAGIAVVVTTLVASLVILVFGEIVPKAFGLGNAESWSITVAPLVALVELVLSPLITVLEAITARMNALLDADSEIEKPYLD